MSALLLRVSVRFARLFRCQRDGKSDGEIGPGVLDNWSVDVCSVTHLGRFVLLSEEASLFTFVISAGYRRSLPSVLETFHRRREELVRRSENDGRLRVTTLRELSVSTKRIRKLPDSRNAAAVRS